MAYCTVTRFLVVLSHRLRKEAEKIQPGQGWLPAPERQRNKAALLNFHKAALNQRLGSRPRHHAVFGVHAVLLLIPVKAILAAHVCSSLRLVLSGIEAAS